MRLSVWQANAKPKEPRKPTRTLQEFAAMKGIPVTELGKKAKHLTPRIGKSYDLGELNALPLS